MSERERNKKNPIRTISFRQKKLDKYNVTIGELKEECEKYLKRKKFVKPTIEEKKGIMSKYEKILDLLYALPHEFKLELKVRDSIIKVERR